MEAPGQCRRRWRAVGPAVAAAVLAIAAGGALGWDEVGFGSASGGGLSGSTGASEYVSLAVGVSGYPLVAWHDRALLDVLVSAWNGTAWQALGEASASPGQADGLLSCYPSLVLDSGGTPVLAWVQESATLAFAIHVRCWDGTHWIEQGSGSGTGGGVSQGSGWALHPRLAAQPPGRLVLAWQENTLAADEILVRQWTGTAWEELGAGSSTGGGISHSLGRARRPAVAADQDGFPVVAWIDDASGVAEIYLRRWDGSYWVAMGATSDGGGGVSATHGGVLDVSTPALAVGSDGRAVVAWSDRSSGVAEILLRRWNGVEWEGMGAASASAGGISASPGHSACPALAITASGALFVAWQDEDSRGVAQIWVRRWDGQQWVEAGPASAGDEGISATVAASQRPAIAVEPSTQRVSVAWDCVCEATNTEVYLWQWAAGASSPDLPQAAFAGTADLVSGSPEATFAVTYSDEGAIRLGSLDGDDLVVHGPHGFHASARLVAAVDQRPDGGSAVVATYAISAPDGAWDSGDNGTYTVVLRAGQVADAAGNWVEPAVLGAFDVSLAPQPPLWRFALSGAAPTALEFGLRAGAATGFDAFDLQGDGGVGRAWFAAEGVALARDVRPIAAAVEWQLVVSAAEAPVELVWPALAGLSDDQFLTLYRVDENGMPVGRSARHLALAGALTVPPGEQWRFVVHFGSDLLFDTTLEAGWNLISLPIEPG